MALTQGTVLDVGVVIRHPKTGASFDPDDVVVTVRKPNGTIVTWRYTVSNIVRTDTGAYEFSVVLDQPGYWQYQVNAEGIDAVAKKRSFTVLPSLA